LNEATPLSADEAIATFINVPREVTPLLPIVKTTIGAEPLTVVSACYIRDQVTGSNHAALSLPHSTALTLLLPTVKARFRTSLTRTIAL